MSHTSHDGDSFSPTDTDGAAHSRRGSGDGGRYGTDLFARPFTVEGGKVREEAVGGDGKPKTWGGVTSAFRCYLLEKQNVTKEYTFAKEATSHRFTDTYARNKTGCVYGADREIQQEYNDLRLVLVTLKGYPWNRDHHGRAPFDFLRELLESNSNVTAAVRRYFGDRSARFTALGAHEHGYPHVHHGLWVNGEVTREDVRPVIEAHLRNSPVARYEDHAPAGGCVRIGTPDVDPDDDEVTWLAREMISQLVGWEDLTDPHANTGAQRFGSLLWASGRNQVRFGGAFRDFIERSQEDHDGEERGDFEAIVIKDGVDETRIPAEELGGEGGNSMVEIDGLPAEYDPVADA